MVYCNDIVYHYSIVKQWKRDEDGNEFLTTVPYVGREEISDRDGVETERAYHVWNDSN